jgi:hypothetical protein
MHTALVMVADEVTRAEFWTATAAVVTVVGAAFVALVRSGLTAGKLVSTIENIVHRVGSLEGDHKLHRAATDELQREVTVLRTQFDERTGPHRSPRG